MTQLSVLLCSFNFILELLIIDVIDRNVDQRLSTMSSLVQCSQNKNKVDVKLFSSIVNVSRQHKKHGQPFMGQNSWKMAINEAKCLQGTVVNLKSNCSRRKEIRFGVKGQANWIWSSPRKQRRLSAFEATVNAKFMSNHANSQLNTCSSALTACSCELMKSSSFRSKRTWNTLFKAI